jgi:predicted amidohydrolase
MAVVRVAFTQATWTGDKESMIQLHEDWTRKAAAEGAQVIGFQELFYGPYFGITQDTKYYEYAETVPGPTTDRFSALAKELGIVIVLPIYEEDQPGRSSTRTAPCSARTASTTSRTCRSSGRSSTSVPATRATRSSRPPSARSA